MSVDAVSSACVLDTGALDIFFPTMKVGILRNSVFVEKISDQNCVGDQNAGYVCEVYDFGV